MDKILAWLMVLAGVIALVLIPIMTVIYAFSDLSYNLFLYVLTFIELAVFIAYVGNKILKRIISDEEESRKKFFYIVVASFAIAIILGVFLSRFYQFDGISSRDSDSKFSPSEYRSHSSSSNSGGNSTYGSYSVTPTPRPAEKSSYTDRSSSQTDKPRRTVDPDDHDLDSYYEDNKDEMDDIDDAWDDFEDNEDMWDDY